jgi:hypothetical protein
VVLGAAGLTFKSCTKQHTANQHTEKNYPGPEVCVGAALSNTQLTNTQKKKISCTRRMCGAKIAYVLRFLSPSNGLLTLATSHIPLKFIVVPLGLSVLFSTSPTRGCSLFASSLSQFCFCIVLQNHNCLGKRQRNKHSTPTQ